jgi:hypothetical protein
MLGAALKRIADLENEIAFGDASDVVGRLQRRAYQRERLRRIDHARRILHRTVALATTPEETP